MALVHITHEEPSITDVGTTIYWLRPTGADIAKYWNLEEQTWQLSMHTRTKVETYIRDFPNKWVLAVRDPLPEAYGDF